MIQNVQAGRVSERDGYEQQRLETKMQTVLHHLNQTRSRGLIIVTELGSDH